MEREGGMRGQGGRRGWRGGEWGQRKQCAGREPASEGHWQGGARAERTLNMLIMLVTLDVSQLDMSALNCPKPWKRLDMSVMAETSQPSMGPCVLVASFASALYSWAAVRRELLSAKG